MLLYNKIFMKIIQLFYRNVNSIRTVYRNLQEDYGKFDCSIRNLVKKIKHRPVRHRGACSTENFSVVSESLNTQNFRFVGFRSFSAILMALHLD